MDRIFRICNKIDHKSRNEQLMLRLNKDDLIYRSRWNYTSLLYFSVIIVSDLPFRRGLYVGSRIEIPFIGDEPYSCIRIYTRDHSCYIRMSTL